MLNTITRLKDGERYLVGKTSAPLIHILKASLTGRMRVQARRNSSHATKVRELSRVTGNLKRFLGSMLERDPGVRIQESLETPDGVVVGQREVLEVLASNFSQIFNNNPRSGQDSENILINILTGSPSFN